MCLKILPILPDFIRILLESPCFPFLGYLSLFCERWPFRLPFSGDLLDSASSHSIFTVVAIFHSGHIFPESPGTFVTLSLFTLVSYKFCTFV